MNRKVRRYLYKRASKNILINELLARMPSLSKQPSREDIRRFLLDKISSLKKEIELYEFLLKMLEQGLPGEESQAKQKDILEVRVDNKTIGLITKHTGGLNLKFTVDMPEKLFEPDSLSRRLKMLGDTIKLSVSSDEKGFVREVNVTGIASSIILDGALEILRQYVIDRYLLITSPKK
jgi:hypothetical protein